MAKGKKHIDYRAVKKVLNRYFDFGFETPRKGKDFTPQQKAAITRKFKKLDGLITKTGEVEKGVSFIPYPKKSTLPGVDGVRTNKGLFYKFPGATAKLINGRYVIDIKYKQRHDVFFPFPRSVLGSLEKIKSYILKLIEKYKPETVRWSVPKQRSGKAEQTDSFFELWEKYLDLGYVELDDYSLDNLKTEYDYLDEIIHSVEFEYFYPTDQHEAVRKWKYLGRMIKDIEKNEHYYNGVIFSW